MGEKRWSEGQTLQFVRKYVELETLWNPKHALYKVKHAREGALKELVDLMGIEGFGIDEARNKIRSIRSTYLGEVNKIERSAKSNISADEQYKPSVAWFNDLQPIMETSVRRKRSCDHELPCCSREREYSDKSAGCPQRKFIDTNSESEGSESQVHATTLNHLSEECMRIGSIKHLKRSINTLQSITSELRDMTENVNKRKLNYDDECVIFGKFVSVQLKQMTLDERIIAQREIIHLLSNARLRQIRPSSHSPNNLLG